jgi:DNA-binding SARP family transcriptional activator/TolB-like protein
VGDGVGIRVESAGPARDRATDGVSVRLLGTLSISRDGVPLELPASRKVLGLFAYLALAPGAVGRSSLCDLLWDVPNDPRGELRWCLSKLRGLLDEPNSRRVETSDDRIALRLEGCAVDAIDVASAVDAGIEALGLEQLRAISRLFAGDFLEGLEIDRSPHFNVWLAAQRRRFRACHVAILSLLVAKLPADPGGPSPHLEKWLALAPLDARAHLILLNSLAQSGRIDECDRHMAASARLFEAEGLDFAPIRAAWRGIRARPSYSVRFAQAIAAPPTVFGPAETDGQATPRASLAVMPFLEGAEGAFRGGLAHGLTDDVITGLAKLRSLFVIARGSVFALAERGVGPEDAGRRLNVDYVAGGTVRRQGSRIVVAVELVGVQTARIVWSEVFDRRQEETFEILGDIANSIVSSISTEIEAAERNRAILKAPNSLNAWEAYHRGLWHMYQFTRAENELARHFFRESVRLDPTFAPGHAGLSFTHWQSAFQRWEDRESESDRAFETAGRSVLVDDHSPLAHWAMGRALWLRGSQEESLRELERAVDLSPNFALAHYNLAFVRSQSGDPLAAIGSSDHSRRLSPFDPLLFGMLGARALAHVRLGQFDEAAEWALKAAARPNAFLAIAAHCLALAGKLDEGRAFAASIRRALPQFCADDFLRTFRFAPDTAALFREGARRIGLD